jgi:very-short-patch-repair endonuclease
MRSNPTDSERLLWSMLRAHRFAAFKFRRQHVIAPYIVDFVCLDRRLVVEADGSQHAGSPGDAARDLFLQAQGFRVLRFWNNDVLARREAVAETILAALADQRTDNGVTSG